MTDQIATVEADYDVNGRLKATPWSRLWARTFDMQIYGLVVGVLCALLFPGFAAAPIFEGRGGGLLLTLLFLPITFLADSLVQGLLGQTPGKAAAGIRVETISHGRLSVSLAVTRNAMIYFRAFIIGLPLVFLFGFNAAYRDLQKGETYWDRKLETRVLAKRHSAPRTIGVAVLTLLIAVAVEFWAY